MTPANILKSARWLRHAGISATQVVTPMSDTPWFRVTNSDGLTYEVKVQIIDGNVECINKREAT